MVNKYTPLVLLLFSLLVLFFYYRHIFMWYFLIILHFDPGSKYQESNLFLLEIWEIVQAFMTCTIFIDMYV